MSKIKVKSLYKSHSLDSNGLQQWGGDVIQDGCLAEIFSICYSHCNVVVLDMTKKFAPLTSTSADSPVQSRGDPNPAQTRAREKCM